MRLPRTLRARLTLWYCATLALVMALFGVLMYATVKHRLLRHHDGMLRDQAAQVLAVLRNQEDCLVLSPAQVATLDHLGQLTLLHEFGGRHEIYYESPQMQANPLASTIGTLGWEESELPEFVTIEHKGMVWRILSEPYRARDGRRGVVRLMGELGEVQETLRHLRFALLLLIPAGIAGSALGGFWMSGRALAPVGRINRMARAIEASNLDQRLPHPGVDDEIGRLVQTLNRMIERLEGSFLSMKRFTSDASHELRNPLATMQNIIEVVLEQPRDVAEQRAALESLGEEVARMRKIVEDLLILARADNGPLSMQRETVRLDTLVQALAETYQARAEELGITLQVAAPFRAEVRGEERWLYQLVGNLLDNALKFTPRGGVLQVELQSRAEVIRLRVRDSGPGIPEASLGRIFERFYQVDPSRTRTAANHPEGGAVFTVELPPQA
jgi:heavy metal sensor kinase